MVDNGGTKKFEHERFENIDYGNKSCLLSCLTWENMFEPVVPIIESDTNMELGVTEHKNMQLILIVEKDHFLIPLYSINELDLDSV